MAKMIENPQMAGKIAARQLMISRAAAYLFVLPVLVVACSGGAQSSELPGAADKSATSESASSALPTSSSSPTSVSDQSGPLSLFRAMEDLATELGARDAENLLDASLAAQWRLAQSTRQGPSLAPFVSAIRSSDSAAQILAFGGATLNAYVDSLGPLMAELELRRLANGLDARTLAAYVAVTDTLSRVDGSDASTDRKSRYCCEINYRNPKTIMEAALKIYNSGDNESLSDWAKSVVEGAKTLASGEMVPAALKCEDWNTWSWWANAKCYAGNLAAPFALVPTLHGTRCENVATCD